MKELLVGNAPCSWGTLEHQDQSQSIPYNQMLDELVETGYTGTELGDWGYMPTDPAALRTEAMAVMSAFLKAQPGIRANFHGLWAYAEKDGKRTPVMELPMKQIP